MFTFIEKGITGINGSDFKFESFYKSHTKEQLQLALVANGFGGIANGKDTDNEADRNIELDRFRVKLKGKEVEIILTLSRFQHIFVGDTIESSANKTWDYGHTTYAVNAADATAKKRTKAIRKKKLDGIYEALTGYKPKEYKRTFSVLSDGKKTGVKKIRFYLDRTGSTVKSIFPEDWGWEEIKGAAILCLENGTPVKAENYYVYTLEKGSPGYDFGIVTVIDKSNYQLITCFPQITETE